MKTVTFCAVLLFSLALLAQAPADTPSSPSAVMQARLSTDSSPVWQPATSGKIQPDAAPRAMAASNFAATPRPAKRQPRVIDAKFVTLFGVATALSVVDVQLTQRCIGNATCHEVNPLYGANPSYGRMYGISFGILGGEALVSHLVRKHHPESGAWMAPLIATSAAHGVGAISAGIR